MNLLIGKERINNKAIENRNDVIKWDVQNITDGQIIKVTFIKTIQTRNKE